jgi:hypothetical protein
VRGEPCSPGSTATTEVQEDASSVADTDVQMADAATAETDVEGASVPAAPLEGPVDTVMSARTAAVGNSPVVAHTHGQAAPEAAPQPEGHRANRTAGHAAGGPAADAAGRGAPAEVPERQARKRPVRRDPVVTMAKAVAGAQKPGPMTRAQRAMADHLERMQTRAAHMKPSTASGVPCRSAATATYGAAGKRGAVQTGDVQKTGAGGPMGAARPSCNSGDILAVPVAFWSVCLVG